jgi:hypothetical protein
MSIGGSGLRSAVIALHGLYIRTQRSAMGVVFPGGGLKVVVDSGESSPSRVSSSESSSDDECSLFLS